MTSRPELARAIDDLELIGRETTRRRRRARAAATAGGGQQAQRVSHRTSGLGKVVQLPCPARVYVESTVCTVQGKWDARTGTVAAAAAAW